MTGADNALPTVHGATLVDNIGGTVGDRADDPLLPHESILGWLDRPSVSSGLRFAGPDDSWDFVSFEQLATGVRQAAWRLQTVGVAPGDVVVLVCPTSPDFVAGFFGALLCGATPSALATPPAMTGRAAYLDHLRRSVRLVGARAVVTVPELEATLEAATLGRPVVVCDETGPALSEALPPPETGLIQFSSGSTGPQRAVRVPLAALAANIRIMARWLRYTRADAAASWLPLHHDMGLVSSFLGPFMSQTDVWLMTPEQFVRSPLRWLRCLTRPRVGHSACPPFALSHVLRRVRPGDLAGMDFSGWRTLVTGAERIDSAVVEAFIELLRPFGFRREAVMPAYGLAEATLAVTGTRRGDSIRSVTVDIDSLRSGSEVRLASAPDRALDLADCGAALPGMKVEIVDDDGAALPPGVLGEIAVSGDSLASSYLSDEGEFRIGTTFRTGDAGFLLDERLFVVGRIGDGVKLRGTWLFAEDLDDVAAKASPHPRKTVVLLGQTAQEVLAVVAVEGGAGESTGDLGRAVTERAGGARVQVLAVPSGWIAFTTSGKRRRREMWQRLIQGDAKATVTWDSQQE